MDEVTTVTADGRRTARLCGVDELAEGAARRFDVAGLRVALVHTEDGFHAVGDRCSHEDFSLADGEVLSAECEIECAKHGSTFDLRTGAPCSLPATRPVPVYEVVVADGHVSVVVP
jgi:3-phenylpropionate/trans-cinnamate dioxygenase ferredoxin component